MLRSIWDAVKNASRQLRRPPVGSTARDAVSPQTRDVCAEKQLGGEHFSTKPSILWIRNIRTRFLPIPNFRGRNLLPDPTLVMSFDARREVSTHVAEEFLPRATSLLGRHFREISDLLVAVA